MNYEDAAAVLAKIQAYDGRNVASANVAAWNEALADIDLEPALAAVTVHFQESTEWLMPAHLVKLVNDKHFQARQRIKLAGPPDFPTGLTLAEEKTYREQYTRWLIHAYSREQAHNHADGWLIEELTTWSREEVPDDVRRECLEAFLRDRELARFPALPYRRNELEGRSA